MDIHLPEKAEDIGHGHSITYYVVSDEPDAPTVGVIVYHQRPDGTGCASSMMFDLPETARFSNAKWRLVSREPLHVEPSLLCHGTIECPCGDHGFIRNGRWEPA